MYIYIYYYICIYVDVYYYICIYVDVYYMSVYIYIYKQCVLYLGV